MESNQKSELVDQLIQKLKRTGEGDFDGNNQILLSKLLSELELSKPKELVDQKQVESPSIGDNELETKQESSQISTEEIMKEIKEMKKQNVVTHWLLGAMIVLTLAWQVSEVSIILHLKNGITHPFKTLGGMFLGMFRVPGINEQDKEQINSTDSVALQMPELPHMPDLPHMPELPHLPELPHMGANGNDKKS